MYCATTVYVYQAKQDPVGGLTAIDLSNLETIINAMEAIARSHDITRAFLQQAYLDIERNGLSSIMPLPTLRKYRNAFGRVKPNIPLLCRSSVAQHTSVSPILPGRLPLGSSGRFGYLTGEKIGKCPGDDGENVVGKECFSAVLGAVTRNVAPAQRLEVPGSNDSNGDSSNKRKRMSPSPGPDLMASLGGPPTMKGPPFSKEPSAAWPASQVCPPSMNLPDRTTSSSSSSPAMPYSASRAATGSSHTSPGMGMPIGLGNTAEENRVDLRAFQGRVSTPLWQAAEEATFFAQINESMINVLSTETGDAWGILDAEINWDAPANAG